MKTTLIIAILLTVAASCHAALSQEQLQTLSPAKIEKRLPSEHPAAFYQYAARLFFEGEKDDAVMWYYIGEIRFRMHLKANPDLDPSEDRALLASLGAVIGREINEYAGGDPAMYISKIEQALKWDDKRPNKFTSKKKFKQEHAEVRSGLIKMKTYIETNLDELRAQREKAGLENRT